MGTLTTHKIFVALATFVAASSISAWAQAPVHGMYLVAGPPPDGDTPSSSEVFHPFVKPTVGASASPRGIDWGGLAGESMLFLAIENGFRCATEPGTRDGLSDPFFRGYLNSVGNLNGWSDGDPFYG